MKFFIPLLVLLCSCSSVPVTKNRNDVSVEKVPELVPANKEAVYLSLVDDGEDITFLGSLSNNQANQNVGSMAYPGYSAATFFGAILVHAMAQSAVGSSKQKKQQEQANKVLEDYRPALKRVSEGLLIKNNTTLVLGNQEYTLKSCSNLDETKNVYQLQVNPVYYFSQDRRSLKLLSEMTFRETLREGSGKTLVVEYVSSTFDGENPVQYWSENDFSQLLDTLELLFDESVALGIQYTSEQMELDTASAKPATIRFLSGGKKKVERGLVLYSSCDRVVFRTLNGSIKSVPRYRDNNENCVSTEISAIDL